MISFNAGSTTIEKHKIAAMLAAIEAHIDETEKTAGVAHQQDAQMWRYAFRNSRVNSGYRWGLRDAS